MACRVCNIECSLSDHRKTLKRKCRICCLETKIKYRTKISHIKEQKELEKYKHHKFIITNILDLIGLLTENEEQYPDTLCRSCFRKVIANLKIIIPLTSKLKTKAEDKEKFEKVVKEKWKVDIQEFPLHKELLESGNNDDAAIQEPENNIPQNTRTDETEKEGDFNKTGDSIEEDVTFEEAPTNQKPKRMRKFLSLPLPSSSFPSLPDEDLIHQTPKSKETRRIQSTSSTTPTARRRLTETPEESPKSIMVKTRGYSGVKNVANVKRRHKIQLYTEGQQKRTTYAEVGCTGIPWENIFEEHLIFSRLFTCTLCNLFISEGKVLPCGHKYCIQCVDLYQKQSNDCFNRCGIQLKEAERKDFSGHDKIMHETIKVRCGACKSFVPKNSFSVHALLCQEEVTKMSAYKLERTEAITQIKELEKRYSQTEWNVIKNHIVKKLQRKMKEKKQVRNLKCKPMMTVTEGAAFRQYTNTSSRTYKRIYSWLKKSSLKSKFKIKSLPRYNEIVACDKEQMPDCISFKTKDIFTNITVDHIKTEKVEPIDMKISYKNIKFLEEDIIPNIEGVYLDPLNICAKQIGDMIPIIKCALGELKEAPDGDEPIQVILKISQDGLGSAPEIRSRSIPVLPDKVFRCSITILQMFVNINQKKHILYRCPYPNSPLHPSCMVNKKITKAQT